ncbi:hypothetical protein [Agarilytica rhodophyticola]|uniref:hypothetical protein n=1 Tax=Agarilytica rhodophyticola TaxID=1737490 RepID=UPI000CD8E277|nr:hypothetical protein [Agarilytica rhodophyticola]
MTWGFLKDFIAQSGLEVYFAFVIFLMIKLYPSLKVYHNKIKTLEKEEFEIMSDILTDKTKVNTKFMLEQLIEKKYGRAISWREISFLFSLQSPSEALSQYISCRNFLVFNVSDKKPSFRGLFQKRWYRRVRKLWNAIWYFFFSFLGLSLIPTSIWVLGEKGIFWFMGTLIFLFYSLGVAYLCLRGFGVLTDSEKFMDAVDHNDKTQTWLY